LRDLLRLILSHGTRNGNYLEILSCLISIEFAESQWLRYCSLRDEYLRLGGEVVDKGWARATRVYTTQTDKPTKPSYLRRLRHYPDTPRRKPSSIAGLDQLEKISHDLGRKPGLSNLSFVILRPADLHDQFRPGYVPCAIAGDFKFRGGRLDLNVMFRTSDALGLGYADIYYTRQMQLDVLAAAQKRTERRDLIHAEPGCLNLYLARAYVERTHKISSQVGSGSTVKRTSLIPLAEGLIRELEIQTAC
jgi:hypothetical protein